MAASYSTKKQRRYGYYVCEKAQQQGASACSGQSIAVSRLERALLEGLQEAAKDTAGKGLREMLVDWGSMAREEQQRRLAGALKQIDYFGQSKEVRLCWRSPQMEGDPITIPVQKPTVTATLSIQSGEPNSQILPRPSYLLFFS